MLIDLLKIFHVVTVRSSDKKLRVTGAPAILYSGDGIPDSSAHGTGDFRETRHE